MSKFERVLSDAELISATFKAEVEGTMGELRAVEQAVLAKLAEQEPIGYSDKTGRHYFKDLALAKRLMSDEEFIPLYANPMPNRQGFLDNSNHIADKRKMAAHALRNLTKELQSDGDYAWSWHCNIAVPIMDSTGLSHREANIAAARLMQHFFGINTEKHPNFEVDHTADASKKVPEGWQLVPKEPTEEMIQEADESDEEYSKRSFGEGIHLCQSGYDHYKVMLAAAPKHTGEK